MKKLILLCCLPILFAGCSKKAKIDEKYGFAQSYALTSKIHSTDIYTSDPFMFLTDSSAVLASFRIPKDFIRVHSIAEGFREVGTYGSTGGGPLDFMQPIFTFAEGDEIYVQDAGRNALARLKLSNSGNEVEVRETWRRTFVYPDSERSLEDNRLRLEPRSSVRLGTDHFAGISFNGNHGFFSLWDNDLNFIRYFGDAPIPEEIHYGSSMSYLGGYLHSHDNRLVFAASNLPYLSLYEINDCEPVQKWANYYNKPVYKVQNEGILFSKDETFGLTRGLSLGRNYIYLVFLDILMSEEDIRTAELSKGNIVFVFDYEGNRIALLNLDRRVNQIAVSSDERTLYGVTDTPDGYRFVEFELPEFGG
ncbi:MAG: TolB-like 6-bladed beta-propeller domain-containing protein [Rikenellaceae bacterium]|nr:TolB-like 6-bladed beta-propeller domain-containing protein [Rikenellaceae bacterium]MCL2692541.1 TolB-like 6-bladed beta-propeller domain-containing protein [Rikenellaceae bacterium]